MEEMNLKTKELINLIDINDNDVIEAEEFAEVFRSFGDFTFEQVEQVQDFMMPNGNMSVENFEKIVNSLMDDYELYKIKKATMRL